LSPTRLTMCGSVTWWYVTPSGRYYLNIHHKEVLERAFTS